MQNITLTLDNSQLSNIQSYNEIVINPEIDFTNWLQGEMNDRLIPLYRDYAKKKRIEIVSQMVDFDIVDKMQEIIDVIKLDKDAEYVVIKQ